jgi:poly-D-alanine transfer protein DltD
MADKGNKGDKGDKGDKSNKGVPSYQDLKTRIESLKRTEHIEVLRYLLRNNIPVMENNNGSWFDLVSLSKDQYAKLCEKVSFFQGYDTLCVEREAELERLSTKKTRQRS